MPRTVDHDERRREIIEALWRVTLRDGLAKVSFREVAAEAQVSVARVQYYFGSKAQLLADSLALLNDRVVDRARRAVAALGPDPAPPQVLRAAMFASLPMDEERSQSSALWFTFYVAAITDRTLSSDRARSTPDWTVAWAADLIRRARRTGATRPDVDPLLAASSLMSSFAGLTLSVLAGAETPQRAAAAIDYQLNKVFLLERKPRRRRERP